MLARLLMPLRKHAMTQVDSYQLMGGSAYAVESSSFEISVIKKTVELASACPHSLSAMTLFCSHNVF